MAPISSVRVATCVVAAALVGAAAATLPAEARAEDGPASAADTAATMPAIDGSALVEEASATVESAVTDALGGSAQAGEPVSAAPVTDLAPSTDTGTEAPVSSPAPSASGVTASMPDTTADSPDTTTDIATPKPVAPARSSQATSSAAQSAPSNVNVSVRIGSAGDNGPVTQVNVAAASSGAATAAASTSSPIATAASAPTGSSQLSPAVSAPAAASEDDPGTWTWQWNCLSTPDLTAISPSGSSNGSTPKNWTWIWNCGSNPVQYQDATSVQYQPSNVNVSIRISSPGNEGPVTQANIAAALGVATGTSIVGAAVHASIAPVVTQPQAGAPAATLPGIPVVPGLPSLPELAAPTSVALASGDVTGVTIVPSQVSIFDMVELPFAPTPLPGTAPSDIGGLGRGLPRLAVPGGAPWFAPVTLASDAPDETGGVLADAGARGRSASEDAAVSRDREKPAPRWKAPAPPQQPPASVSSGTSVAPASGGGSSGSGIPIFLALPFVAAMLDLARRVTLDRVALPSGHRSRMPENPG